MKVFQTTKYINIFTTTIRMTFHIDYVPTEDILFNQLSKRSKYLICAINKKKVTAQDLLDEVE